MLYMLKTGEFVSTILFFVMMLVTVIMAWKMKIYGIWMEYTGRKEQTEIRKMKEEKQESVGLAQLAFSSKVYSKPTKQEETTKLYVTEQLVDAQIQDETCLLEEMSYIPVKQENVAFQVTMERQQIQNKSEETTILTQD